jgi:hypothetical protein
MLVAASMAIWGTEVTGLQFFGYSVALGGMVYYKLGYEQLKGYFGEGSRQWADFGQRKPVLRKLSVIALSVLTFIWLLSQIAPGYSANNTSQLINTVSDRVGGSKA